MLDGNEDRGFQDYEDRGFEDYEDRGFKDYEDRGFEDNEDRGFEDYDDRGFENYEDRGFEDYEDRGFEDYEDRGFGINAQKCLYEGAIVPTALFGAETRSMRSSVRRKVKVLVMKCFNSLVGWSRMEILIRMKRYVEELEYNWSLGVEWIREY